MRRGGLSARSARVPPRCRSRCVTPLSGVVYCGVIASCEEAFEPRRAREWTNALARWCEEQPQLVSFTGRCVAHRAGIMQLHGQWHDALEEARLDAAEAAFRACILTPTNRRARFPRPSSDSLSS